MKKWIVVVVLAVALIAIGLFERGEPDLEYTTTSAEAHTLYEEGNMAIFALQWNKAQRSLEKAVELDPEFAMARAALATAYTFWGHPEQGRFQADVADSLARLLPDENERLLVQARVAAILDDDVARQDSLVAVLQERIPDNVMVLVMQAMIAERNGDRGQAEALWQRVLEVNPNFAHAYNTLGYAAAYRGSYDEAIDLLQKYTYLAPDLANPHDSLAEVLTYVGRYEEAEQEFRMALALQSDFFPSLVGLARIFLAQGRVQKGMQIMEKTGNLLRGSEVELRFLFLATRMYLDFWMPAEFEKVAKRFIELYPEESYTGSLRVLVATIRGDLSTARSLADSVMAARRQEVYPRLTEPAKMVYESLAYRFQALFAHYANDLEAAAAAWEKALTLAAPLAPHEVLYMRVFYARTLAELGRNLDALEQAQTILQTNSRVIAALEVRAKALLALNELPKAQDALQALEMAVAKADPDFPAALAAVQLREEISHRLGS